MMNPSNVRDVFPMRKWMLLLFLILAAIFFTGCPRELGVYTLCSYEDNWKGNVCLDSYPVRDPYYNFWSIMTGGSGSPYADPDESVRYRNEEVNIKSVLPIPGDAIKGWDEFDMVFFYGHNNMIVPPHPHDTFGYYTYDGSTWTHSYGYLDDIGWGDTTPYCYYSYPLCVTSGQQYPGAVIYLYYKYTSCLLGGVYHHGQGTGHHWRLHWNDPVQYTVYGQLGAKNLEWLILYGCQAVITANENGMTYNSMGLRCFHWTQGKWHIILGHYRSYFTSSLKPLDTFAYDLLAGVPVQEAYFDTDPDMNSSAIAAEEYPFPGWAASTMVNDKWTDQQPDHQDASIFTQRWISIYGTDKDHWD